MTRTKRSPISGTAAHLLMRPTDQTAGGLPRHNRPESEALRFESLEIADRVARSIALDHDIVPKKLPNLWLRPKRPEFLKVLFGNGPEPEARGVENRLHQT